MSKRPERKKKKKRTVAGALSLRRKGKLKEKQEEEKEAERQRRYEEEQKARLEFISTEPIPFEERRLLAPIRCKSCGKPLAHKSEMYLDLQYGGLTALDAFERVIDSKDRERSKYIYFLYSMMITSRLDPNSRSTIRILSSIIDKHDNGEILNDDDIFTVLGYPDANVKAKEMTEEMKQTRQEIRTSEIFYKAVLGDDYDKFAQLTTRGIHPRETYTDNNPIQLREIREAKFRTSATNPKREKYGDPTIKDMFDILNLSKYNEYISLVRNGATPSEAFTSLGYSGEDYLAFISDVSRSMQSYDALEFLGYYGHMFDVFMSLKKGYVSGKEAFITMGSNGFEIYIALRQPNGISKERALNILGFYKLCCRASLENPIVLPVGRLFKDNNRSSLPDSILYPYETMEAFQMRERNTKIRRSTVINHIGLGRQEIIKININEDDRIVMAEKGTFLTVGSDNEEDVDLQKFENEDLSDGDDTTSDEEDDEVPLDFNEDDWEDLEEMS
uniref:RNA polymerase N 8 kDa subunit n=1 Tax=Pithovirus LCPAC406 TaxID=2506599 RepID=A0A481ZDE4_9VIRU|nr:MAG: RNA polymerase N 8 kDa subunit [Pithovirus LCPAC406]